jgi:hypothetical protein
LRWQRIHNIAQTDERYQILKRKNIKFKPIDKVEVTVLMDSMAEYVLPAPENVVRSPLIKRRMDT